MSEEQKNTDEVPTKVAEPSLSDTLESWLTKVDESLKAWGIDLDKMSAKAGETGEDARAEYEKQVASLREQLDKTRNRVDEITKTQGEAAGEMRKGVQNAWGELRKGIEGTAKKLGFGGGEKSE